MTIFILCLHLLAAVVTAALWRRGRMHFPPSLLPVALLLPLWGPVFAAAWEIHYLGGEKADREAESSRFGITDEVYRNIRMEKGGVEDVLPIEDVLVSGSPQQRRRLLLSVLHSGPEEFVRPLRTAGVNDDTEVVHYAVTALVEMRSHYAQRISSMEEKLAARPSDPGILLAFADLDEEYLRSGIPENSERTELLAHCRRMLEQLLNVLSWQKNAGMPSAPADTGTEGPENPGFRMEIPSILTRLAHVCLQQKDCAGAEAAADQLIGQSRTGEEGFLIKIRARAIAGDGPGIAGIIREIREKGIYLSPGAREELAFWSTSSGGV